MAQPFDKCANIMVGHAIADEWRASTHLALQLSKSLRKAKRFDGSDIMARYLYLYHISKSTMGEATKLVYEELKASLSKTPDTLKREHFYFSVEKIYNASQSAHDKLKGLSGGCNPAQRSFPLALCPWIDEQSLFQYSCAEARLTHVSPAAGQVAAVTNLICRHLLQGVEWTQAVASAFSVTTDLLGEVQEIKKQYTSEQYVKPLKHPAYAPATLYTSLYCVTRAESFENALQLAIKTEPEFCPPLVGILAAARWPVPRSLLVDSQEDILEKMKDVASDFNDEWEKINRRKQKNGKK